MFETYNRIDPEKVTFEKLLAAFDEIVNRDPDNVAYIGGATAGVVALLLKKLIADEAKQNG